MKLSREWLSDYLDLSDLSDDDLGRRMTEIGHAIEAMEKHGEDTVIDAEITTNRVDAMSHLGMARELAAALGRDLRSTETATEAVAAPQSGPPQVQIRIEAPEMCSRFSAMVVRGVTIKPSPPHVQRRLEAVGLRPINNVVDVTNYVMLALGHPMHAYDLEKLAEQTIIVRRGNAGERMKTLDGETRAVDAETCVIADARRAIGLGGVMGGGDSEIGASTKNLLLECAWFNPSGIRRTARRLGMKTDASYRFERRVDPNDTLDTIRLAAKLIVEFAGGTPEAPIDVLANEVKPKAIRLRPEKLAEQSGGAVPMQFAHDVFRRLGFGVDGEEITIPTHRGDIHEEMDLVEEVLRFFGLNNVPAELPRLTTGDTRPNPVGEAEDEIRRILTGSGCTEAINYSFIRADQNPLFSDEQPLSITNSLSENIAAMRLSLLPGLLESVVFNRSYGNRDGALFEIGRTYHRGGGAAGSAAVVERHRAAVVMFGTIGTHWGDAKRAVDFFDIKGVVEQIAQKFHVELSFAAGDQPWLRKGRRALVTHGDRTIGAVGFLAPEVLQKFGIKGEVAAAELDVQELLASTGRWTMAPVARFPGVPMILAFTHGREVEYARILEAIRSFEVPHLHEVGVRDRFVVDDSIKTTLGMWYQAFDRSLTQEEVSAAHQNLAARLASALPLKLL